MALDSSDKSEAESMSVEAVCFSLCCTFICLSMCFLQSLRTWLFQVGRLFPVACIQMHKYMYGKFKKLPRL